MNSSQQQKYIAELESRIEKLSKEKAKLSLLKELFANFETSNNLEDIITTILNDALELHGGQNIVLYYVINERWYQRDLYGNSGVITIDENSELSKVLKTRSYLEVPLDGDGGYSQLQEPREGELIACDSFIPIVIEGEVIAILLLKNRLKYDQDIINDFTIFFNYAGIVLKNAINNLGKLHAVSNEFEQIFHCNNDGMIVLNNKGVVRRINNSLLQITGLQSKYIEGVAIEKIDVLKPILDASRDCMDNTLTVHEFDTELVHAQNKNVIMCIVGITPLLNEASKRIGCIIYIKDITERKKAKEALKESEKRFSLAIKGSNDGLWDWNLENNEVYYSHRWKSMLGYDDDEIKGELGEWQRLVDPVGRKRTERALEKVLDGSSPRLEVEFKMKHKQGYWVYILSRAYVMYDDNKKPYRLIGVHTDLTEIKRKEGELREALKQAQESEKLKAAFLANMSHEIRTPMNGIIGFSEVLMSEGLNNDQRLFYARLVMKSGERLLTLVNDILDYSKIDSGNIEIQIETVDVNSIINELEEFYRQQVEAKNLMFKVHKGVHNGEVPIKSDKSRIIQVMSNLISNAIKFTEKGMLEIGYKINGESVMFFVRDTGIGIPEDMQTKIFERFMQADLETSKNYGGTGLGLAISQRLIDILGGKLKVNSAVGEGSDFYFTLPFDVVTVENIKRKLAKYV